MSLEINMMYRSEIVTVADVRCRPHDSCRGTEEATAIDEIVFPRRGCFVRHIGRHQAVADANTVHFFRKDEGYHVSHPLSGGDDCTCCSFAPDVLADAFATFDPRVADHPDDPFRPARALSSTEAFVSLHQFRRNLRPLWCAAGTAPSILVDEAAMRLLEAAARSAALSRGLTNGRARAGTISAHRELSERTRVVLSEGMCEPLTLPEIGRRAHSSPFHLARVFRRMTGLSLHEYLTGLRLRAALERLADGAPDLMTLALSLGFANHGHFSDAFRRAFHVTPSAFRLGPRSGQTREMSTNPAAYPSRLA